jgi:hypothetical protein
MYPEGFDLQAVAVKLRNLFCVEQDLPLQIERMLAQLNHAES